MGYGGTAAEMARLINESGVLQGEFEATAENVKDIPYDIIIQAIHATQEEMGIAGTTAKEAAKTISGSFGMLKGAWSNLLTGLADPNADLDKLFENVIDAAETVLDNLLPVVQRALTGMTKLIGKLAPTIARELPKLIQSVLPALIKAAGDLVAGLAAALPELLGMLMDSLLNLIENAPDLLTAGIHIITGLIQGINKHLDDLIPAALNAIEALMDSLIDNAPELVMAGVELLVKLAAGVIKALPILISKIPELIKALFDELTKKENLEKLKNAGIELAKALLDGLESIGEQILQWGFGIAHGIAHAIGGDTGLDFSGSEGGLADLGRGTVDYLNSPPPWDIGAGVFANARSLAQVRSREAIAGAMGIRIISDDSKTEGNTFNISVAVDGSRGESDEEFAMRIAYEIKAMFDREAAAYD